MHLQPSTVLASVPAKSHLMRFMSISFKIKLCWKKNFLLQNYFIYDLQAGTEVRQNGGQGTSDPFYCSEWLKLRVLRDDFRKVQGPNQFLGLSPGATFSFVFHRCQPACDRPPWAPAAAPTWGGFKPISELPSHKELSRRALKNVFVSNICCVAGRNGRAVARALAPWKAPPDGPLTPVAMPRCGHCWPWGALCKMSDHTRVLVSIKRCYTSHWGISRFLFLFQKLGSSLIWGD